MPRPDPDDFLGVDKRHHPPQLGADLLEWLSVSGRAHAIEVGPAVVVFFDPLFGKAPLWMFAEELLHRRRGSGR